MMIMAMIVGLNYDNYNDDVGNDRKTTMMNDNE